MNFEDAAQQISPEIYQRFKEALELGKWPDGRAVTTKQKEICLQAIIVYETAQGIPEHKRTGYVDSTKKTTPCGPKNDDTDTVRILH
ncbi:MAG: YeaC family protein [Oleiphilus sp.]